MDGIEGEQDGVGSHQDLTEHIFQQGTGLIPADVIPDNARRLRPDSGHGVGSTEQGLRWWETPELSTCPLNLTWRADHYLLDPEYTELH